MREELTPEEKDELVECFATGLCMGGNTLFDHYCFHENFLGSGHLFPHGTNHTKRLETLQNAMVKFIKRMGPGYEHVTTPEDFLAELKEYYKK